MKSYFPNLILLFLASVAVALLIRYTDIVNIGMGGYWEDGVAGVKKIFYGQIPHADLDAAQKQKAREEMAKNQIEEPLFCGSAFFPWLPGANWQYRLSDGSKQDLVNLGVPAPGENSYFLDGQLASSKEWTVRSLFRCMEGKLWLTDFGFWEIYALEKTVTTPCVTEKYDFSLPQNKDFSKGSAWTERGCLKHEKLDQSLKKVEVEWEENIEARWKALGPENIRVPAGEFPAEKLEVALTRERKISTGSRKTETLLYLWVAREVGIVKISSQELGADGKPLPGKETTFQELTAFQIPTEKSYKKIR